MKKRKGFTLIELLAVIVILAIIALIATPIILNIINDSREKSNQRSVESFQKAVETTVGQIMMDEDYTGSDIVCMLGSKIINEVTIENKENDETYCWDVNDTEGNTVKQVTYSGSRVKPDNIIYNRKTGDLIILNAQVGSSKNKYSVNNNVATIVSALLKSDDGDNLFKDPYGNIRYRGKNPNNYVTFNDEDWRIIGIVDGKVKIIKDTSIGSKAWDSSNKNDWSQASLQKYLNETYYNELNSTSKNMIEETTWYLGGWDTASITSEEIYTKERGNVECSSCTYETIWTGKIALMYPSDYGYAASENCSSTTNLLNYSDNSSCKSEGNWLYKGAERLLTPYSDDDCSAWVVDGSGMVYSDDSVGGLSQTSPTLYLKSNVKITGGKGTVDDPYQLSL